jgi:hypothetical protein
LAAAATSVFAFSRWQRSAWPDFSYSREEVGLDVIDVVATDAQTPEPMLEMLRGRDVQVVVG